ncbi:hypothetical protein ACFVR6_03635 [Microbacterium sp. NPDC058021]|uniref:hypothetical protein n=1 Tax=Microbacterium sp. NPDC058021 TaxID=3346306 RepID=UPI0036DDF93C
MSFPVMLASPPVGDAPVTPFEVEQLSLVWEGPDGTRWDLRDQAGGIVMTGDGVEGLHNPIITKFSSKSRAVPGKRARGWRAESRDVFWPLFIWADGSNEWSERVNEFLSSIHPDRAGTWRVRARGIERTLRCTGVFTDSLPLRADPLQRGWALYPVALEAEQPYWAGEVVRRGPWAAPDPRAFFPGPPLTISSSSAFGSASIPNQGDVEAWGVWTLTGPLSDVVLGVGDKLIHLPFSLSAGQVLVIDTDPRRPTATLDGANWTRQLGLQEYAAVPPGQSVPLHLEATGAGQVTFDLVPLFFRAF